MRFDRHHHDCHEYWLISGGRAIVEVDGDRIEIGPGDIVCTEKGVTHDILAVDGWLEMHWFETATDEGGRVGHLHHDEVEAAGHVVTAMPGMGPPDPAA